MRIKTLKDNVLIGDTIHEKGAVVEIDDRIGKRLVDGSFAQQVMGPPPRTTPATGFETASAEPRREKAAHRA